MSGITGLGTTYNLPNYTGILFGLTPADTPLFSAIGGLNGGAQCTSTEFEWSTYDLRNAAQNVALEGATAPTAQERVRGNVTNVVQIQQEKVSVSYSKTAAFGMKSGTNNTDPSSVTNEIDFQLTQMLKQMVRDIEWSFINGAYVKPSTNATARSTKGLMAAVTTNVSQKGTESAALSAATDTITEATTPVADGKGIVFTDVGVATAITTHRVYYVVSKAAGSFKVAATPGGTAITIGTATVKYILPSATATDTDDIDAFLQGVYDNGGLNDTSAATIIVNSRQKRAISSAYASAYGKFVESSRNVGGVNVNTIVTDFGTLNVMLNRFVPQDALIVASLEQLNPVFLEIPGKGHFFAEPLAKTGASDEVQLYGEVGLAYGSEKAHGVIRGLAV
jgi:hypothetical protein